MADDTCRFIVFDFDNHEKGAERNDFDVLNKLDEKDHIRQGSHRSKSIYITKDSEAKAKELMEKYGIED